MVGGGAGREDHGGDVKSKFRTERWVGISQGESFVLSQG